MRKRGDPRLTRIEQVLDASHADEPPAAESTPWRSHVLRSPRTRGKHSSAGRVSSRDSVPTGWYHPSTAVRGGRQDQGRVACWSQGGIPRGKTRQQMRSRASCRRSRCRESGARCHSGTDEGLRTSTTRGRGGFASRLIPQQERVVRPHQSGIDGAGTIPGTDLRCCYPGRAHDACGRHRALVPAALKLLGHRSGDRSTALTCP